MLRHWPVTAFFVFSLTLVSDGLSLSVKPEVPAQREKPSVEKHSRLRRYNPETYLLAYNVYIAKNEPKKALAVTLEGMEKEPENIEWQRRAASVAGWAGQKKLAVDLWFKVFQSNHDPAALDETIRLAKVYYDDEMLLHALNIKLKDTPGDLAARLEWVGAMERQGRASEAITVFDKLSASSNKTQEKFYLDELSRLYQRSGNVQQEMAVLEKISKDYEVTAQTTLRQVAIYFNAGEVLKAESLLKQVLEKISPAETEYWITLAELAWLVDDRPVALKAYQNLYATKALTEYHFRNMLDIMFEKQAQKAFYLGVRHMQYSTDPLLFADVVEIGDSLNEWPVMGKLLQGFSAAQTKELEKSKIFWRLRPYVLQKVGAKSEAKRAYQQTILKYPEDQELKADYVWMLIEENNLSLLNGQVEQLSKQADKTIALDKAYAMAALKTGHTALALHSYQRRLLKGSGDISLYMNYAQALEQNNMTALAEKVRQYAWRLIQSNQLTLSDDNIEILLTWAKNNGHIDAALPLLAKQINEHRSLEKLNAFVLWAMQNQEYTLARYLRDNFYTPSTFPAYAAMELAIIENNRPAMSVQLLKNLQGETVASIGDVQAAAALGHLGMARDLAYQQAQLYPDSTFEQLELRRLLMLTADSVTFNQAYERAQSLQGPITTLQNYSFLNSHWQADASISRWGITKKNDGTFYQVAKNDSEAQVRLEYLINPGYPARNSYWQGTIGYRSVWQNFYFAKLQASYATSDRSRWTGSVGYNQKATESSPLRIAGVKDNLVLSNIYNLSPRHSLTSSIETSIFRNQSRHYLGMGVNTDLTWQYLLRQTYPDVIIAPSISADYYRANGSIAQTDENLISRTPGSLVNTDIHFFMPFNQVQGGVTLYVGQSHHTVLFNSTGSLIEPQVVPYKRRWRPFFSTSLYHTYSLPGTFSTLGLSGGVAGGLFGHDNLSFYFDYSMGQGGANLASYLFGLQYKYYY